MIIHGPAWGRPAIPSSQDSIPESIHSNLPGYNPAEDFFAGFPNETVRGITYTPANVLTTTPKGCNVKLNLTSWLGLYK